MTGKKYGRLASDWEERRETGKSLGSKKGDWQVTGKKEGRLASDWEVRRETGK